MLIEADVALSTKRDRIQRAIRSLLELGVIDDAIKHVRRSAAEINKKAKQVGSGSKLNQITSRLETIDDDLTKWETDLEDAKEQFAAFDEKVDETDRKIAVALQKGDKEKLQRDLDSARREIKQLDDQLTAAIKEHSALFRSRAIALDLLSPLVERAYERLEESHDQGKIPNMTIPVLQERLSAQVCICGEMLAPGDPDGEKRRKRIRKSIDDNEQADELQEIVTDLYYGTKALRTAGEIEANGWLEDYREVVERRDGIQTSRDEVGRKLRALEQQLDSLSVQISVAYAKLVASIRINATATYRSVPLSKRRSQT